MRYDQYPTTDESVSCLGDLSYFGSYGALMWSLGKVIRTPEVLRVYLGSFWDKPYAAAGKENEKLFDAETAVRCSVFFFLLPGLVRKFTFSPEKFRSPKNQ